MTKVGKRKSQVGKFPDFLTNCLSLCVVPVHDPSDGTQGIRWPCGPGILILGRWLAGWLTCWLDGSLLRGLLRRLINWFIILLVNRLIT